MVLVDTSIWIDHLKKSNQVLSELLYKGQVVCHPFIIGEMACGSIKNRSAILSLMRNIPTLRVVGLDELMYFIENKKLCSRGIGFVDMQLLASVSTERCRLWTKDKRLNVIANELGVSFG